MQALPAPRRPGPDELDERYLSALAVGDEAVLAEMVRTMTPFLFGCALRLVADRSVAEDVVQDTWVVVLTSHHRFEGRSRLRTWMVGTLTNIARRRRRSDGRVVVVGDVEDLVPVAAADGPDATVLAAETYRLVHTAMQALPGRQREVVRLRDVVGLGSAEVCEHLAVSPENQRVLLHRGRAQLRAVLVRQLAED